MNFPSTPVLTTFSGGDEDPLSEGGAWQNTEITNGGSTALLKITGGKCAASAIGILEARQPRTDIIQADQEAWCIIDTLPASGKPIGLALRVQNPGTATAKCYWGFYTPGTGFRFFSFINGGTFAQIGSTAASPVLVAGDLLGARIQGQVFSMYAVHGGQMLDVLRITDGANTVLGAGSLGLDIGDLVGLVSVFGGGPLGQIVQQDPPTHTPLIYMRKNK